MLEEEEVGSLTVESEAISDETKFHLQEIAKLLGGEIGDLA